MLLKKTPFPVFRDKAPSNTAYPYIVYTYINQDYKRASGSIYRVFPKYQVSLFTTGVEDEFKAIRDALNERKVLFSPMNSIQGDENDETVTNFYITVGCVEDVV